jgi:hypothetical protein
MGLLTVLFPQGYIPSAVISRIMGGQQQYLNEFRKVTTLFMLLPEQEGFFCNSDLNDAFEEAQNSLWQLQQICGIIGELSRLQGGDIRQIITDDKGTVAIAVFGLQAGARTPLRAVLAAIQIYQQLKSKCNADVHIGITTGQVFCGTIGSQSRREYVFGDMCFVVLLLFFLSIFYFL